MKPEATPAEEPTRLARALASCIGLVCRFPRTVLFACVALAGLSVYASYCHLQYRTQRNDLMSADKDYQKRWRSYLAEFGDDDDMVVVVEGDGRARMEQAVEAVADAVRQFPDRFDRLFYKVDLRGLAGRALLFLPPNEIAAVRERLDSMGMLLGPFSVLAWREFTLQALVLKASACVRDLAEGKQLAPADRDLLAQLPAVTRSAATTLDDPAAYVNPWPGLAPCPPERQELLNKPQYFFSGDGKLAFLLVRPLKASESFTPALESVRHMRALIAATQAMYPDLRFGLTGLPVLETDEMAASEADSNFASWLALAGVGLLYLLAYRSFRYPLMTVATLIAGTVWAMGLTTLTVGHLNILSATFAVMLIGMGDYGVLWVARYEEERRHGCGVRAALRHTAMHAGPSILTAAATTALAFYATTLADFQAVSELGWIAGSGVLLCALACFIVMPALLVLADRKKVAATGGAEADSGILPLHPVVPRPWLPWMSARPRLVVGVTGALLLLLGVCACRVGYDHNLLHMQARGLDSVDWELKLIERTAGASWHALSIADSPAEALALKARYEQLPEVSRVVEVASLVPADQEAKLPLLAAIRDKLEWLPAKGHAIDHPAPNVPFLKRALAELEATLHALPPEKSFPAAGELSNSLAALRARLGRAEPGTATERLRRFEQRLSGDLANGLHQLRDVATPKRIELADLPADLRDRYVGSSGKWLVCVFPKESLWEYGPLTHFVETVRRVDPEATGKPFGTLEGLRSMKGGFQWAGVYALIAIVLVLTLDFGSFRVMLLALWPLVLGVVCSLGLLSLCGLPLNPANLIALPLIVGVGVDNGVHVLHDYRERPRGQLYQMSAPTGRGILVAALTTMLGFGTLMISRHQGLYGLGLALTLGVGCCMVAALVVLPAMLRLRDLSRVAASRPVPQPQPEEEAPMVAAARRAA